ncbi:MAG: PepSY domain-containing protein [Gammaproteobacteria bacterium]|nr:PepSY domain-containing protein [Gammaproteobacteria bacterium]
MAPRKRQIVEKLRSWYLWHRYLGLAAAIFAAWLAISGIVLNHTEDLALAEQPVNSEWLLDIYNIPKPDSLEGHEIAGRWIVDAGNRVYIDRLKVAKPQPMVTALPASYGFIIVFADAIQLYTEDGILVEEIPFTAGQGDIIAAEASEKGFLFRTLLASYSADEELLGFERLTGARTIRSPEPRAIPAALLTDLAGEIRASRLNQERLWLDLHSGRLFGMTGVWVADAAGIALLLLALSGIWIWQQRARARRRQRQSLQRARESE